MQRIDVQTAETLDQMRVWFLSDEGKWVEIPWLNPAFFQSDRTEQHGEIILYLGNPDAFLPVSGWWHRRDQDLSSLVKPPNLLTIGQP